MNSKPAAILEQLLNGKDLGEAEAADLLRLLTDEALPQALSGALLAALRAKGETAAEVRGFASAMRSLARRPAIPEGLEAVDIVGTGGDGSGSLNLSTGGALLTAACGLAVVKHGNRSVSSKSGSADVLEVLGLPMPLDEEAAVACLAQTGFTFLFAPHYHPAMKALAPVRRSLGVRTVFNLLGPLTNPAEPPYLMLGAFSMEAAALMADTLAGMNVRRAFVVHGEPGWDEPTPVGPYELFRVENGQVQRERHDPADFGLARCSVEDLAGGDAAYNAAQLRAVFACEDRGPHRDALMLGAALALQLSGKVADVPAGIQAAAAALDDGRAAALLQQFHAFGQSV